ncbi:aspartate--tRNA(Asp/Asn) ligase [Platysternon megacephalum]|uniref:Aspartate--tRNA(Asp/Asn) ligase n=1 Tax=Platysternon megacephalum TaxID=55544 RepID=A0A4D9DG43_9SAUR|nr:aspartate--tRNA(Asp/Asn) ligase [Platysternon megacephalum]
MDFSGTLSILLAICIMCLLLLSTRKKKTWSNLPPGPTPIPFLGNMLQVEVKELIKSLRKLSETYGPIYTFYLGSRPCVVLSGYKVLKEALIDKAEEFSGRGDFPAVQMWSHGNGEARTDARTAQSPGPLPVLQDLESYRRRLLFTFPKIMRHVPGPHRQIYQNYLKLAAFVGEQLKMHKEILDPNNPRDFIDCFLIKIQQEKNNPSTHFNDETMSKTTVNLFFAGTETVSSTLRYGLRILLRHPEIEEKLHEEIDRVIGPHRSPCMEDRSRMPYADAVIHEIQRFADIVPMGVPHTVTRDIQFRGYTLPKDLNIIPLLCTAQADPTQFKNPTCFDPSHFLDENGRFRRNDAFMAFSAGKRVCLGESLALMELFIFLTTTLQHFALRALVAPAEIDITPESSGLGSIPRPYQFCLLPR